MSQCRNGDGEALATLATAAKHHGDALARMVQLLDPSVVFLSGRSPSSTISISIGCEPRWRMRLDGHFFNPPPIWPASLGEFSGAHGAAAMAAAETVLRE